MAEGASDVEIEELRSDEIEAERENKEQDGVLERN